MAHARTQIRDAVAAAVTGLATTGTSVSTSMVYQYETDDLPALSVDVAHTAEVLLDELDEYGDMEIRELPVMITARVKASSGVENTLDVICAEVETALSVDTAVLALVKAIRLRTTEIELDGDGEIPVGVARMEWAVLYRLDRTTPGVSVQ